MYPGKYAAETPGKPAVINALTGEELGVIEVFDAFRNGRQV